MTLLFNDSRVLHRSSIQHSHILSDVKNINQADSPVETIKLLQFIFAADLNLSRNCMHPSNVSFIMLKTR